MNLKFWKPNKSKPSCSKTSSKPFPPNDFIVKAHHRLRDAKFILARRLMNELDAINDFLETCEQMAEDGNRSVPSINISNADPKPNRSLVSGIYRKYDLEGPIEVLIAASNMRQRLKLHPIKRGAATALMMYLSPSDQKGTFRQIVLQHFKEAEEAVKAKNFKLYHMVILELRNQYELLLQSLESLDQ